MTELTTMQAVDHHTAKLNGTWLYRAAAAQEPGVIYGSHVHPDLTGGTAQPSYEGSPEARPFTREEQVERAARSKRKGALAAYRDATIFKVIYGWGLRRTETARLDVADFGCNPRAPQFGRYGTLNVRYGKAKRGQPLRRNVLSVMGWAVEAVADYVEEIRPRFGFPGHPALRVTERGGRVKPAEINARFTAYRDALGLLRALTVHSERRAPRCPLSRPRRRTTAPARSRLLGCR